MLEYTKVDGVMVGRAALGAPWLISQIHNFLTTGEEPQNISISATKEILLRHIKELISYYGEKLALPLSRKYVCWYCKNLRDARKFRENYVRINNFDAAFEAINDYFNSCEILKGEER